MDCTWYTQILWVASEKFLFKHTQISQICLSPLCHFLTFFERYFHSSSRKCKKEFYHLSDLKWENNLLVKSSRSSASASAANSSGVFFFRISGFGGSGCATSTTSSFFLMLYCGWIKKSVVLNKFYWAKNS